MGAILNDGKDAGVAAEEWLKANPKAWEGWLDGVTTFDGQPGLDAVKTEPRALIAVTRGGRLRRPPART